MKNPSINGKCNNRSINNVKKYEFDIFPDRKKRIRVERYLGVKSYVIIGLSSKPARQLPEDESDGVDVSPLPGLELVRVDRLVQNFWCEVTFCPDLAVVRDVNLAHIQ